MAHISVKPVHVYMSVTNLNQPKKTKSGDELSVIS